MKLVTYLQNGKEQVGLLEGETVRPLPYDSMNALIETAAVKKLPSQAGESVPLDAVRLLAPIPRPRQDVVCLGMNYHDHLKEAAQYDAAAFTKEKPVAVYFSKRVTEAVPPEGIIPSHRDLVRRLDYEVELAIVIGKTAKDVKPEEAGDYIFGYTVLNDVSARLLQTEHKQWYFGKSLDGFFPMGPCIVTAEEIPYPPRLSIRSYVNGELRQNSSTDLLIFDIDHVISELSQGMTLEAGTIIAMGTPAGAGMGFDPPRFLKPGDVVCCSIEKIGKINNPVV